MSAQLIEKAGRAVFTRRTEDPHDKEFILTEESKGEEKRIAESQSK